MQHPFQCLACVEGRYLVAACGPKIISRSLENAGKFSEWTSELPISHDNDAESHDGERPKKKQKTAKAAPKAPNVIKLTVSPNQRHVVAVTDDKYVRVFEQNSGELTELSQRSMPKRPCAIQVLPDNATILVGDKFGDVYSLPLMQSAIEDEEAVNGRQEETKPEKVFKSSATNLTVHSQRNLKALEAQQKQKDFTPRKEPLKFKHELLLGHVSMLTDVKYVRDSKNRGYIITADRDEHIRISRGPPQAYVIEGFCLGHTQFISKVCQVGESDLLVSGGGDSWLGIWRWPEFKLLKKFDLMRYLAKALDPMPPDYHPAVSGIWSMDLEGTSSTTREQVVVVACEMVKALLLIPRSSLEPSAPLGGDVESEREATLVKLDHNPLDVTVTGNRIIVSLDGRKDGDIRLQSYNVKAVSDSEKSTSIIEVQPEVEDNQTGCVHEINGFSTSREDLVDKDLDDLLYGVARLRKRGPQAGQEGAEDDEGPEEE